MYPWKAHLARKCPVEEALRDGCPSFGAVWKTLELNHNGGYVSRVTPSHNHNDSVQMLCYLLTNCMAKFYYSYEYSLRDRNAPIVTVRWRSGGDATAAWQLVVDEPIATTLHPRIQYIIRRRQLPLIVKFYWGELTAHSWPARTECVRRGRGPTPVAMTYVMAEERRHAPTASRCDAYRWLAHCGRGLLWCPPPPPHPRCSAHWELAHCGPLCWNLKSTGPLLQDLKSTCPLFEGLLS